MKFSQFYLAFLVFTWYQSLQHVLVSFFITKFSCLPNGYYFKKFLNSGSQSLNSSLLILNLEEFLVFFPNFTRSFIQAREQHQWLLLKEVTLILCTINPHNTFLNLTQRPIVPINFFLCASKNPGNILVTQPLLGMKNYQSWSRAMVLALTAKKRIGFVNGKIVKPEIDSPLYEDWESCNTMVLSWLISSMHVDVSSSIMYCEIAREMWLEFQHVFSQ